MDVTAALAPLQVMSCDVFSSSGTVLSTGETTFTRSALYRGVPCRLSFSSSPPAVPDRVAARPVLSGRLFLPASYEVPPGSLVTVSWAGRSWSMRASGPARVYPGHQEIDVVSVEARA